MKKQVRIPRAFKTSLVFIMILLTTVVSTTVFTLADDCSNNHAPNQPTNPHPPSGTLEIPRNVTIGWDCTDIDGDDLLYDVYFDSHLPASKQSSKQADNSYTPGKLRYNTRYYWMVIAYDPCGRISISKLHSFITLCNTDPHPPSIVLSEPMMNQQNISIPATIGVTVFDSDDDFLTVTFFDKNDLELHSVECEHGDTVTTSWPNLEKNTKYEWYATVSDDTYTITSDIFSFTTTNYNYPPVAITSDDYAILDEPFILDATESYDTDGSITGYRWDVNNDKEWDTAWTANPAHTHTFNEFGEHIIGLQVKDNEGKTSSSTCTISVVSSDRTNPVAIFQYTPIQPTKNTQITFDATHSYDSDGSITGYRWDFTGDGSYTEWSYNPVTTWSFASNQSYPVTLQVKDDKDLQNESTQILLIGTHHPPNIPTTPYGPSSGSITEPYSFTTSSTDIDGDNICYGWDWNNDNIVDQWTTKTPSETTIETAHTWNEVGTYTFKVKAKDDHGLTSSFSSEKTIQITESNICPPQPSNPSPQNKSTDIALIGEYLSWECIDPNNSNLIYTVYFNTSSVFTEPSKENLQENQYYPGQLQKNTTYYWKILVLDQQDSCQIESPIWQFTTTNNACPTTPKKPNLNGQSNINPCSQTLSWESTDSDLDDLSYTVYFDDSSPPTIPIATGISQQSIDLESLNYDTTYYWRVEVTDNKCDPVKSMEWSFKTKPKPCKAIITAPTSTESGKEVTFSASSSQCENGQITSCEWDFGDGTTAFGEEVKHVYRGNDTFLVRLTITCQPDCLRCSDTTTKNIRSFGTSDIVIEVVDNPFSLFNILPLGGNVGESYTLKVKGTHSDRENIQFIIKWDDNTSNTVTDYVSSGSEKSISHIWNKEGEYQITISAQDEWGSISTEPIKISTSIRSPIITGLFIIAFVGIIIVAVQVAFVIVAHRKKMFQ